MLSKKLKNPLKFIIDGIRDYSIVSGALLISRILDSIITIIKTKFLLILLFAFSYLYAQSPGTKWTKTFGGIYSESGSSVEQTSDGGYIIAGSTTSFGSGQSDVYLIKTNSLGDTIWTRTFGGNLEDIGYSVEQTSDGGYIIAGPTQSYGGPPEDFYLIKTDSLGDTLWIRNYGGTEQQRAYSIQQTTDNGYIVAGLEYDMTYDSYNILLIKINYLGDSIWSKVYGGEPDYVGKSICQTFDGGYIIVGYTRSAIKSSDIYLIKTNSLGDTLWTRAYGGNSRDVGQSVQQTADGGYIIAGYTCSFGVDSSDVYLIKTDSLGDTLWTKTYGGITWDIGNQVQQTADSGYVVVGNTESFGVGGYDVYLIKTKSVSGVENENTRNNFSISKCIPNPFFSKTNVEYILPKSTDVKIAIYNYLGQVVREIANERKNKGKYSIEWDGKDNKKNKLPSGVYILRIETGENTASHKLLLIR